MTASANGTVTTPLTDAAGHVFRFDNATSGGNYNIARDGTVITTTGGTTMLVAGSGVIYERNASNIWLVCGNSSSSFSTLSTTTSGTTTNAPNGDPIYSSSSNLYSWGAASGSDYAVLKNGVPTGLAASSMNYTSGILTAIKADSSQWQLGAAGWIRVGAPTPTRYYGDQAWSSSSVWNKGVGSGATWGLSTDADVIQLRTLTGALNAGQYSQPMYVGHSTDPLVTVTSTNFGSYNVSQTLRIPVNATPAAGADQHMNFIDLTQPGKLWSFYGCTFNNGQDVTGGITALLGDVWDATGAGLIAADGNDNNFWAGTITEYDINQGAIKHMTRIALSADASHSPGSDWATNIHWPNYHEDFTGPTDYTGSIDATSTFGIPSSVNLASMGFTQGGLMLATAIQTYGSVWRDSGGTNQMTWYAVPTLESHPRIQEMRSDMSKIMSVINIMRNQSTDNGATNVNGGGTYPTALPAVSTTR